MGIKKLGLKVLQTEEKWKKKYPNVSKKIDDLEDRIKYLEVLHRNDGK